jgi:thymidine kinase
MSSYLDVTFGPMFSGKTTNLIHKIHTYLDIHSCKGINKKGLIINFKGDNRDLNKCGNLTTHSSSKKEINSNISFVSVNKLSEVSYYLIKEIDYIAIDEGQFYEDLEDYIKCWLHMKKHIHCSGLISDSNKNKFGNIIDILPLADNIEQLKAYCIECRDHTMNAPFTKSKKPKSPDNKVLIGGQNFYIPVCGKHF